MSGNDIAFHSLLITETHFGGREGIKHKTRLFKSSIMFSLIAVITELAAKGHSEEEAKFSQVSKKNPAIIFGYHNVILCYMCYSLGSGLILTKKNCAIMMGNWICQ